MTDQKKNTGAEAPPAPAVQKKTDREVRAGRALRENLKRRKAQLKARDDASNGIK